MKLSYEHNSGSKKAAAKVEQQKIDDYKAVSNHAGYETKQEYIAAPFGKAFKTGAHIDKKKESKRGGVKHKGKGWD